jgi:hypothetical protein
MDEPSAMAFIAQCVLYEKRFPHDIRITLPNHCGAHSQQLLQALEERVERGFSLRPGRFPRRVAERAG